METVIIAERKKKYLTDLIISATLLIGALTWLIIASAPVAFIVFIVLVLSLIPSFVIAGYIWDVTSKITLSDDGVTISYGRSIMDIVHFEGSFTIPRSTDFKWDTIADFHIETYSQESSGGSDGANTTTTNHYLIIMVVNQDYSNPGTFYRRSIKLKRYDKSPDEVLSICKQFQSEYGNTNFLSETPNAPGK